MNKQRFKEEVLSAIDDRSEELIKLGEELYRLPELGYREKKTSRVFADRLESLGLEVSRGLALTGVMADLPARERPLLVIMGELDAVVCPGHPQADPETGAAHACGHHAQMTSVVGAAMGLTAAAAQRHLGGGIRFMGVPAEEYVEIEYRRRLREEGKIEFMGGKQEMIRLGYLDGIQGALMMHLGQAPDEIQFRTGGTSNGFVGKFVRYLGREAHAGSAPHQGVNALSAAMLGIMGVNALRETFRDGDYVRIHPIISQGGNLVNIVPADVRMETYVRGRTLEVISEANSRVNRALRAGAMAVGGEVEIDDLPGYLPRRLYEPLEDLVAENAREILGPDRVEVHRDHMAGSSDFGDVTHLMPGSHPTVAAASGRAHSEDYRVADPRLAYVESGKILAAAAVDLLWDGASLLREQAGAFTPAFSVESYLETWRQMADRG